MSTCGKGAMMLSSGEAAATAMPNYPMCPYRNMSKHSSVAGARGSAAHVPAGLWCSAVPLLPNPCLQVCCSSFSCFL